MGEYTEEEANISLCADCIGEVYLATCVPKEGIKAVCDQCETKTLTMTLLELSRIVDRAFERHYEPARYNPQTDEFMGDPPECIISDLTGISHENCEIIRRIIEQEYYGFEIEFSGEQIRFSDESSYELREPKSHNLHWEWQEFEKLILSQARFFSTEAKATLDKTFNNIETLQTKNNEPVVTVIGPNLKIDTFYRGRYFHDDQEICEAMERPDNLIGPPPTDKAQSGRMNAEGISVFYGATDPQVALAEIRPPVGSRVVMAEFRPIKSMNLLNLSLLKSSVLPGSIFDPKYADALGRIHFLKSLVTLMTRPTNPSKDSEYLPTQVIADYLANAHESKFDGILYPSSQSKKKGLNVVLFHKSSKVIALDVPKDMQFYSDTYEQDEQYYRPHYTVREIYKPKKKKEKNTILENLHLPQIQSDPKKRIDDEGQLKVDPYSLKVHEIEPIIIETIEHDVERTRHAPYNPKF